jgi:hypothetical protein
MYFCKYNVKVLKLPAFRKAGVIKVVKVVEVVVDLIVASFV